MAFLWVGFTVAYVSFFYVFQDAREIADSSLDGYLEVILLAIPSVVLLAAAMWLHESDTDPELRPPVIGWTAGSALLFVVAMYAALFVIETTFDPGERWLILLLSTGFGASSGSVIGIMGVRSKQSERERNRSRLVARRRKREREQLEHLNNYLRHEVLNEVAKINGYAGLLAERGEQTEATAGYLDIIRHSSEDIALFIDSIRDILDTTDHDPELEVLDVVSVIETELDWIGRSHPEAELVLEAPDSAFVLAGDLLDRVLVNLIENAVEHNEAGVTITLSVEADGERVSVRVSDDGRGIPRTERERLFEPPRSGDHGYGLFLTRNLVELYGGRLELHSTGPAGTEFVIELLERAAPEGASTPEPSLETEAA